MLIQTPDQLKSLCHAECHAMLNRMNSKGQRVLDIGCGDGRFTLQHFPEAATILGVDTKQDEIDDAISTLGASKIRNVRNTQFLCADIVEYPLAESSFDIVIFLRSF